jgi:hypothetical protein
VVVRTTPSCEPTALFWYRFCGGSVELEVRGGSMVIGEQLANLRQ